MHQEKGRTPLTITLAHPNPAASARPTRHSARPMPRSVPPGRATRGRFGRSYHRSRLSRHTPPSAGCFRCPIPAPGPVRAEHLGTAADLESRSDRGSHRLPEHVPVWHRQHSRQHDSPARRCSACRAGSPGSPGPAAPKTPRYSSWATRSPCSSARSRHRNRPAGDPDCAGPAATPRAPPPVARDRLPAHLPRWHADLWSGGGGRTGSALLGRPAPRRLVRALVLDRAHENRPALPGQGRSPWRQHPGGAHPRTASASPPTPSTSRAGAPPGPGCPAPFLSVPGSCRSAH